MNPLRVKDAMTHLVVTLRPEDKIPDAAKRLFSNRISGAPVVKNGRLVGVVSEADLVQAYAARSTTVGDVMTRDVISTSPDASIWEAACLIDRHHVRRLPVVDANGYVSGVLSRSDLIRCMARALGPEGRVQFA